MNATSNRCAYSYTHRPANLEVTMTTHTTTARTTSSYFLRAACTPDTADQLLDALVRRVVTDRPVIDQHTRTADPVQPYVSVGFRATSDEEATRLATIVLSEVHGLNDDRCILTGYGIHRRTVATPEIQPA